MKNVKNYLGVGIVLVSSLFNLGCTEGNKTEDVKFFGVNPSNNLVENIIVGLTTPISELFGDGSYNPKNFSNSGNSCSNPGADIFPDP